MMIHHFLRLFRRLWICLNNDATVYSNFCILLLDINLNTKNLSFLISSHYYFSELIGFHDGVVDLSLTACWSCLRKDRIPNHHSAVPKRRTPITHWRGAISELERTQIVLTLANVQLDAQIFNTFIRILYMYMFRAISCSSSGGQIVLIQHLVPSLWKQVSWLKLL
jgi:hypothetical protein